MRSLLFCGMVVAALASILGAVLAEAQQDSLILLCEGPYPEGSTVHIPAYVRVNEIEGQGVTAMALMFYNDHPGLSISSIKWSGTSIGEEATAIETYIVGPQTWAMGNVCGDGSCRGGTALFTFETNPSIPSGHHLLCWLVVETGAAGDYLLTPRNGIGLPASDNVFLYYQTESLPALAGCQLEVLSSFEGPFVRGDVDGDGGHDIFDGSYIFRWLGGLPGYEMPCLDAADVVDDGDIDIFDGIRIFTWLGGASPAPPAPCCDVESDCGPDPTADGLDCRSYPACGWNP